MSMSRCFGVLVPLFSVPSETSWGIGEIPDLALVARWCRNAGCSVIQLLPVTEMPFGETSPYSSLSAMAIDPQFIALRLVPEFEALGGEAGLLAEERDRLDAARTAMAVDYPAVRSLKSSVLRRCFERFRTHELDRRSLRASQFLSWCQQEAWWLDDYALFRALHHAFADREWTDWPSDLRDRDPGALVRARAEHDLSVQYAKYVQWLAGEQWATARAQCEGVRLFGDLPFMVSRHSADVWARQTEFRMDVSVGAPPDAFSETGQDWKLPLYRWDVVEAGGFAWIRERGRRYATLFDGYRIDHLVGFFRTYYQPHDGSAPAFSPPEEAEQIQLGACVLKAFASMGSQLIAEDLGVIPTFVRETLATLGVPGLKVFRWEREWQVEGQPFIDPRSYPERSAATSGTHDTEPMTLWWESASEDERRAVLRVPLVVDRLSEPTAQALVSCSELTSDLWAAITEALFASGSDYLILPLPDVFRWRDRINTPATVGPHNWTWRLPWPVEGFQREPEARLTADTLARWSAAHRRSGAAE